jgi:hypothetical protein
MKVKAICSRRQAGGALLLLLLGVTMVRSDIGGGSGKVRTPYKPDAPVRESEVLTVKRASSKTRELKDVGVVSTHIPVSGSEFGLMYLKGNVPVGNPVFEFQGKDESGVVKTVDFAELESFQITKYDSQGGDVSRALVEIVQFPVISPGELLQKRPSYTALKEQYTQIVRLWVNTKAPGNKKLCLVGKDFRDRYRVLTRLSDLPLNATVKPDYGSFRFGQIKSPAIWWAIDSVTKDKKYPYRVYFKKR